jgi:hypothetical protein
MEGCESRALSAAQRREDRGEGIQHDERSEPNGLEFGKGRGEQPNSHSSLNGSAVQGQMEYEPWTVSMLMLTT